MRLHNEIAIKHRLPVYTGRRNALHSPINAGVHLRISQPGFDYVASVGVDIIFAKIREISIPDQQGIAVVKLGKVKYELTNVLVSNYSKTYEKC